MEQPTTPPPMITMLAVRGRLTAAGCYQIDDGGPMRHEALRGALLAGAVREPEGDARRPVGGRGHRRDPRYRFVPKNLRELRDGGCLQVLAVQSLAHPGTIVFNPQRPLTPGGAAAPPM